MASSLRQVREKPAPKFADGAIILQHGLGLSAGGPDAARMVGRPCHDWAVQRNKSSTIAVYNPSVDAVKRRLATNVMDFGRSKERESIFRVSDSSVYYD